MSKKNKNIQQLPAIIPEQESKHLAVNIHFTKQMFKQPIQTSLFNSPEEAGDKFSSAYGIDLLKNVKTVGVTLTDFQLKVLEGVLKFFKHSTENGYTGNIEPKNIEELKGTKYNTSSLPFIYNNISNIPRIRITQSDIIKSSGAKDNSRGEKERVLTALDYLSSEPFLFYYKRLVKDSQGKPKTDNNNKYSKEEVMAVDTLLSLKIVRDDITKEFKYYEIELTGIFLDQLANYFLLIPHNWREEIKRTLGGKEVSSYTMLFLLWLRLQYEEKRRNHFKKKVNYEIRRSWESIAEILKMPETLYKRNKKNALKIIDKAIQVALKTGYLLSWERREVDIMVLNPDKYYTPKAKELLN